MENNIPKIASAGRPLIRHCCNCKWSSVTHNIRFGKTDTICFCRVKYKDIEFRRIGAVFCKYYEQEE